MPIQVTGIVLAGGLSSRFGTDKAQAKYCGNTFLERAHNLLKDVCGRVVISGTPRKNTIEGAKCIPDKIPGGGPMSGIATVVQKLDSRWLLIIPCDMPLISPDILQQMIDQIPEGKSLAWQGNDNRIQPFPMLLNRIDASEAIKKLGQSAGLSIKALLNNLPHKLLQIPNDQQYQFCNINTQLEFDKICHNQQ